jgi:hypothetical protein
MLHGFFFICKLHFGCCTLKIFYVNTVVYLVAMEDVTWAELVRKLKSYVDTISYLIEDPTLSTWPKARAFCSCGRGEMEQNSLYVYVGVGVGVGVGVSTCSTVLSPLI